MFMSVMSFSNFRFLPVKKLKNANSGTTPRLKSYDFSRYRLEIILPAIVKRSKNYLCQQLQKEQILNIFRHHVNRK